MKIKAKLDKRTEIVVRDGRRITTKTKTWYNSDEQIVIQRVTTWYEKEKK